MRKFMTNSMPFLLVVALVSGCGSSSKKSSTETSSQPSSPSAATGTTVKSASNASLGGTVLVDTAGMTLYSLSGEQNGKFICKTSACEAVWHPLLSSGAAPTGAQSLGTVKRPDGSEQVTYKGRPLYTFAEDTQPGEAKGEGIKDVGTWKAVMTSASSSGASATSSSSAPATPAPSTTQSSTTPSSGGGGGYGY